MKKRIAGVCALSLAALMSLGLAACNTTPEGEFDASAKIASFTGAPTVIDATFTTKYTLEMESSNPQYLGFGQNVDDTVTIQADLTAGNLYFYGKRVDVDEGVVEQLIVKESSGYVYVSNDTPKTTLTDDAAAKTMIGEAIKALTNRTSGTIDLDFFVYGNDWVKDYLLLGSETHLSDITVSYSAADNDGLKAEVTLPYVGYLGDIGAIEFETDETHTGGKATVTTDSAGFIKSFSETINNFAMPSFLPTPTPLYYVGSRSLTASYNGTLTKKTADDITTVSGGATVTFSDHAKAAVKVEDMVIEGYAPTSRVEIATGDTVDVGHYLAVTVTPESGYEVINVYVNGTAMTTFGTFYAYQVQEEDVGSTLAITITIRVAGTEGTTGTIVVTSVDNATIETYDLLYPAMTFTPGTTVEAGHFIAFKVTCVEGYAVDTATINGQAAMNIGGYYLVMSSAIAGETYTVAVTLKAA